MIDHLPPAALISEMIEFEHLDIPTGNYRVPSHLHHFHQLNVILEGRVEAQIEGADAIEGEPGTGWLIPPLVWHGFGATRGHRQVSFKFHLAPGYWSLFGTRFRRYTPSPLVLACIASVVARVRDEAPLTAHQIGAVAVLCLVDCFDKTEPVARPSDDRDALRDMLLPLLVRVETEPHANWSVSRMSAECHMSPDHFSRRFHAIIGQTPQLYLMETRMRASAAELLAIPEIPIKELARRAGYTRIPAFTHAFKQVFHVTPAAYRNRMHREPNAL